MRALEEKYIDTTMGNASSEANGAECKRCGCGLPRNNWRFVHAGDGRGYVYLFHVKVTEEIEVTDTINVGGNSKVSIGAEGNSDKKGSLSAAFERAIHGGYTNSRKVVNAEVFEYIRFKGDADGYYCLPCIVKSYKEQPQQWQPVLNEINALLRSNNIKVRRAEFIIPSQMDNWGYLRSN